MAVPRSAWMVSWPGEMFCLAQVSLDQPCGEAGALAVGDHPADHVAAEDVEDHVQVEVGPLDRALELGDVPGPDLVRLRGQRARAWRSDGCRSWSRRSRTSLRVGQDPVHRPRRAEVGVLLEQRGVDLGRRCVAEALGVQRVEDRLAFVRVKRARAVSSAAAAWAPWRASAGASGRARPGRRPGLSHSGAVGTSPGRPRRSPTSVVLFVGSGFSGGSPGSRHFFLDFDDHLGLLQLPLQPRVLLLQLLHPRIHGLGLRVRACALEARPTPPAPAADATSTAVRSTAPRAAATRPARRAALHASACLRIFSRYSALKRRRFGFATTSGSGARPASAETPVALRAPSVSAASFISETDPTASRSMHPSLPAPTLISQRQLSHRLLARGVRGEELLQSKVLRSEDREVHFRRPALDRAPAVVPIRR